MSVVVTPAAEIAAATVQVAADTKAASPAPTSNDEAHINTIVTALQDQMAGKPFDRKKLYALIAAAISVAAKFAIAEGEKKKQLVMKAFEVVLKQQKELTDADREDILAATNVGVDLLYYQKKDSKKCCC